MAGISKEEIEKLLERAKIGMKNAFDVRTNFPNGAAILTFGGEIFQGCNVESVISGLGTCAERCAIDNAIANGHYCFKAMVITSKMEEPVKPCGVCLQYIGEFAQVSGKDIEIIMVGSKGKTIKSSIRKMLPNSFGPKDLNLNLKKFEC